MLIIYFQLRQNDSTVKIDETTPYTPEGAVKIISQDNLKKTLQNLQKRNFVIMQPNEVSKQLIMLLIEYARIKTNIIL